MAEFSGDRMEQMQRDAIRRVEEMQSRAKQTLDRANMDLLHGSNGSRRREQQSERRENQNRQSDRNQNSGNSGGILSEGFLGDILSRLGSGKTSISSLLDGDTAILIAIGLLLFTDNKDELLLLAIIYIML